MLIIPPLIFLGVLEGFAFIWEKQQAQGQYAWELVASRRIELDVYRSPGAGYTLMKPGKQYEYQGIPVVINDKGLRSPATSYEKPEESYRILSLGDSIAMGWAVQVEDLYSQRLAEYLPSVDGRPIEVINAGVPGWNLENELSFLQAEGMKYNPDLVILEITLPNDIFGDSALVAQRPGFIDFLRAHTNFWPFLTIQMRWIEARAQGHDRIPVIDPPHFAAAYFPEDPAHAKWDEITGLVGAMESHLEAAGIPMLVVLFPIEDQVFDPTFSTVPQEVLMGWMAEAQIPAVDLLPAYQAACAAKPGGPCTLEDRYLFADVWMHPSPLGNEIAAQQIAEALAEMVK